MKQDAILREDDLAAITDEHVAVIELVRYIYLQVSEDVEFNSRQAVGGKNAVCYQLADLAGASTT
ncbi:MAG TPA: hypothetical protein PKD78_07460 [Saprospiraceae bacterium]|nr:hypothetical protein [Saprospiraceae bacterium]